MKHIPFIIQLIMLCVIPASLGMLVAHNIKEFVNVFIFFLFWEVFILCFILDS